MATQTGARVRRRERKNITSAVAHINATFNHSYASPAVMFSPHYAQPKDAS